MRAFVLSSRAVVRTPVRYYGIDPDVPSGSASFKSRERASETKAMAEKDRELLEKLKAKLRAEKQADNSHHVEVIERLQKSIHDISLPKEVLSEAKNERISAEELMALRKELVEKVRALEDQLAELKLRK